MTEAPWGGQDSARRKSAAGGRHSRRSGPHGDVYTWYQRGLELLAGGARRRPPSCWNGPAEAEPGSRSVLEALGRAQFDTAGRRRRGTFRRIVEASPSDDYAHFGWAGAGPDRRPPGRRRHWRWPPRCAELRHYTDALRGVRPP